MSTPSQTFDPELVARLKKALTAEANELESILQDPSPEVLHALLKNVFLTEEHILKLLKRRDMPALLLKSLARHKLCEHHRIAIALVCHPSLPPALSKQILARLHLFELLNLCYLPGQSTDIRMAAEHAIIQRLPMVALGNRVTLARRATATILSALLKEGHTRVIEASLSNPRLQEVALFQFLNGSTASAETISQIARHPRWSQRCNLRRAILKNCHTPRVWFIHFLPKLSVTEARNLLHAQQLSPRQKSWIREYLEQRNVL
ncbi:MAG: hypothetical protein J7K75_06400 [Desulfuromonas sp.]|nr:hypothetical protein [Desulfuromonas sp.]